jgi:hypothetical protein
MKERAFFMQTASVSASLRHGMSIESSSEVSTARAAPPSSKDDAPTPPRVTRATVFWGVRDVFIVLILPVYLQTDASFFMGKSLNPN